MDDQQQVSGATTPQEPAEAGAGMSEMSRLTGLYFSPGEVFDDINRKPTWVVPIVISMVMAIAFALYFQNRVKVDFDQLIRQKMEERAAQQGREIPADQMQAAIKTATMFAKFAWVFPIIVVPAMIAIIAGALFLVFQMFQADTTFKKAFSVVAWAQTVRSIVEYVLNGVVITLNPGAVDPSRPEDITMTNLGAFFNGKETSPALISLLTNLDVFTIWYLILLILGFKAISKKFTTGKSATVVLGLWFIWIVVKVGWSALRGS